MHLYKQQEQEREAQRIGGSFLLAFTLFVLIGVVYSPLCLCSAALYLYSVLRLCSSSTWS
jgi:hypothetical protein